MAQAPVKGETLRWARESAGYDLDDLRTAYPKIEKWEKGEEFPPVGKARDLAKKYDRSLTFFYLPVDMVKDEKDVRKMTDFRRGEDRVMGVNLVRFLKEIEVRQQWARDYLKNDGHKPHQWVGSIKEFEREQPSHVAEKIRSLLGESTQPKGKTLGKWIDLIEEKLGVFVMQSRPISYRYKVVVEGFSGCALPDDMAPVIGLNYADNILRRTFTLFHELAHLFIGQESVDKIEFRLDYKVSNDSREEVFCNKVAAEFLMPEDFFRQKWQDLNEYETLEIIEKLASTFKVSKSACIVRAQVLRLLSADKTKECLEEFKKNYDESQKKKIDKPTQETDTFRSRHVHAEAITRCGKSLSRHILSAYDSGSISAMESYDLFQVKLDNLPKIAKKIKMPLMRWIS